ncbi:hypothetical protein KSX14_09795, partial [Phocaeicola vulgatus]
MQIIFASVSYRRVVADLRLNTKVLINKIMTNDIFYVFQHTRGSKLGVEYNNLLKNAFMALFSMII